MRRVPKAILVVSTVCVMLAQQPRRTAIQQQIPDHRMAILVAFGVTEMLKMQLHTLRAPSFDPLDGSVSSNFDGVVRFVDCANSQIHQHNAESPQDLWPDVDGTRVYLAGKAAPADEEHACQETK